MKGFSVYYINALVACILLFWILLVNNRSSLDRQEKQIKLDRALISFMLYFLVDCFWAGIADGLIPKTRLTVIADMMAIYLCMVAICYSWLEYTLAVEQVPHRNRRKNKLIARLPFLLSTAALVINFLAAPQVLIDENLDGQLGFSIYLLATPTVYLGAVLFITLSRARGEENPAEKRKHLMLGFLPLSAIVAGLLQELLFSYIPIYCFVDALLIVVFYIQSIEARVSIDPLTNLNNRGVLTRYISQRSNIRQENRLTVAVMADINNFKIINDSYGHAEGDRALVIISDALKQSLSGCNMPCFLGRYGGDEFILILHPVRMEEANALLRKIQSEIKKKAEENGLEYELTMSMGCSALGGEEDSIQECIKRADRELYNNKKNKGVGR